MPDPSPLSLASLLDELHQKQYVLGGWSAVLSLSESSVQRLVEAQWPATARLAVEWTASGEGGVGGGLGLTLGAPSFTLAGEGNTVSFRQAVTAATLRHGPASAGVPANLTLPDGAALAGSVSLTLRTTDVSQHSIVALDLAGADVTLHGVEPAGLTAGQLAAHLAGALTGNQPYPPLVSLDVSPDNGPSSLRPASLQFQVAATASGARVLQLFVGGQGGEPTAMSLDVAEPVPTADGCDYSLLVESAAVVQDVVSGFNAGTGQVKMVAVNAARGSTSGDAAYFQTRVPMQFQGTISCGKAITPIQSTARMGMNFKGSPANGLTVSGYALPGGTVDLQLAVAGSFPLQVTDPGGLTFSTLATTVTASGVAENTVKPRLESFFQQDIGPNLGQVRLSGPTDLLLQRFKLPGLQPRIDHAQLPADLLLAGSLVASSSGGLTAAARPPGATLKPPPPPAARALASESSSSRVETVASSLVGDGAASLANLLAQMNQNQEVLQGWDAVVNVLESSMNSFLQAQWNQQTGSTGQLTVTRVWCQGVLPARGGTFYTNVTQFNFVLGAPLFQFPNGQTIVNVTQTIQSGAYRTGTLTVPSDFDPSTANLPYNDPDVYWSGPDTPVSLANNANISGTVVVSQVQGVVNSNPNVYSLVLNFAQGTFTLNNLTISGVTNGNFSDQLKDWFTSNPVQYVMYSVDTTNYSNSSSFQPTSFQFNVVTTNSGNTVVQLLVTTDGSTPSSTVINVNEPVPTADGLTCSLMISSRILYNDVLVSSFSTPGGAFNLVPISPQYGSQIWQAAINPEFHFAGSFSYGSCCDRTTDTYSIYLGGTYSGSTTSGFILNQNITTGGNAPVQITVYASYPVNLSGSGTGQQINITPGTPQISVTGSEEGELTSDLQNILNGDFQNAMSGISFASVTRFALQNVLFPGNLIQMTQAQVPGDLLIVGTFTPN